MSYTLSYPQSLVGRTPTEAGKPRGRDTLVVYTGDDGSLWAHCQLSVAQSLPSGVADLAALAAIEGVSEARLVAKGEPLPLDMRPSLPMSEAQASQPAARMVVHARTAAPKVAARTAAKPAAPPALPARAASAPPAPPVVVAPAEPSAPAAKPKSKSKSKKK